MNSGNEKKSDKNSEDRPQQDDRHTKKQYDKKANNGNTDERTTEHKADHPHDKIDDHVAKKLSWINDQTYFFLLKPLERSDPASHDVRKRKKMIHIPKIVPPNVDNIHIGQ